MLNITFKGDAYLLIGNSLAEQGAITTADAFREGRASFAHWYPDADGGRVQRYGERIGTGADVGVVGPADDPGPRTLLDLFLALDNLLGGDPDWTRKPSGH